MSAPTETQSSVHSPKVGTSGMAIFFFIMGACALLVSGLGLFNAALMPTAGSWAEAIAGVIFSLLLVGAGEVIDKLHKIEFHLRPK